MDDPWGSPWASSDTTSKHQPPIPTPSPPKDLLSPPPRAFFGSTSNLQVQSPWASDDGFGVWAGAEQTDVPANALDWGVWAEPPSRISQPSPRPESINRNSIALPSSAATSPGLRPLPRSRASSVFRHHSPDPWATELSLQDKKPDSPTVDLNALGITAVDDQAEILEIPALSAQRKDVVETLEARLEGTQLGEERVEPLDHGSQERESPSFISNSRKSPDLDVDSVPKVEIHDNPSRPSSTLSLGSSNEIERQDSPITSIDEDPKSRLHTTTRKVSGKVQELVGLFDDLAKAVTEEPSPPRLDAPSRGSRERSPSQTRGAGTEDDADFGDFEDAKSEYSKPVSVINTSTPSETPPTPKAQVDDTATQNREYEPAVHENAALQAASAEIQKIIEKFGPIRFDVNFQPLDEIFPDHPREINEKTGDTDEIPERIIQDSFTSISERKIWYRISRFGSMRKHDSGDEDNYHRVEWSKSHLHSDTIKIVRRWMEEDSIAGRVTVGAGKRTSVFNWDSSSAAPVDLGKVFARKASVTHSRNSSNAPQIQSPVQSVYSAGSSFEARRSIKSPILPPPGTPIQKATATPGFRWSTDSIRSPPIALPTKEERIEHAAPNSRAVPTAINAETRIGTAVQAPVQVNQTEVILDDEDDDWGEMVSSPRVDAHPGPALTTQPSNNGNGSSSTIPTVPTNDIPKANRKTVAVAQSNNPTPKLSVSIPQSSQAPKQVLNQAGSSSAVPRADPWPLADFSIFESLSAGTPKSLRQDPWPLADFSVFESPTSGSMSKWMNSLKSKSKPISKPRESQSVRASMDQIIETPTSLKAVLGPIQNPDSEREQDAIVRGVIQNLPDFSYMLH